MSLPRPTLPRRPHHAQAAACQGRSLRLSLCALALLASQSACSTVDLKRMTYEMLAQEDCLRNQLDDFCARSYSHDYQEYERVRLDYLRNLADETANDAEARQ